MLSILFAVPQIEAHFRNLPPPPPPLETAAPPASPVQLVRLPTAWQSTPPEPAFSWSVPVAGAAIEPAHTFDWASDTLRRIGTVTHAFLHQIAREGPAAWDEAMIARRSPSIRAALLATGVSPAELDGAGAKVIAALQNVLGYARGRWILEAHAEARSELEISAVIDDDVCRLKIDRTFLEAACAGSSITRWRTGKAARGKTSAPPVGKVSSRLGALPPTMAKLDPRPVRLALYFPLLSQFLELTDGDAAAKPARA